MSKPSSKIRIKIQISVSNHQEIEIKDEQLRLLVQNCTNKINSRLFKVIEIDRTRATRIKFRKAKQGAGSPLQKIQKQIGSD
jgi:hypothetical protein